MAENSGGPHESTSLELKRMVFALKLRSGARSVHHHALSVSSLLAKNGTETVHRCVGVHLERKRPIWMAQTNGLGGERAFESVESVSLFLGEG